MKTIQVYDPALCCPTGVCGPSIDPALVQFAADLDWLRAKGVTVERFNLAQQPGAFADNATVRGQLAANGTECLPLVMVDGGIAASGAYPSRRELADLAGVTYEEAKAAPLFTLPMADSGGCCPLPNDAPPMEGDGACCPWPKNEGKGGGR